MFSEYFPSCVGKTCIIIHLFLFIYLFCFKDFIYLFMRDTERGRDTGRGRSRPPMRSLIWDLIPGPRDHALSQRQTLNHWTTQVSQNFFSLNSVVGCLGGSVGWPILDFGWGCGLRACTQFRIYWRFFLLLLPPNLSLSLLACMCSLSALSLSLSLSQINKWRGVWVA